MTSQGASGIVEKKHKQGAPHSPQQNTLLNYSLQTVPVQGH